MNKFVEAEFGLTSEEFERLSRAPFLPTEGGWNQFAGAIHECVLEGYASGEIDFRKMMQVMWDCSLGCDVKFRISYQALTSIRALKLNPKYLGIKRPPFPKFQKNAALELMSMILDQNPGLSTSPTHKGETLYGIALQWLKVLRLDLGEQGNPIKPNTLYRWRKTKKV